MSEGFAKVVQASTDAPANSDDAPPAAPPASEPPATPPPSAEGTPPATPPPAAPPVTPENADDVITKHQDVILKAFFGENAPKSAEDARKIISQIPALAKTIEDLQKNKVEFHSDYVKGLNEYLKQGGTKDVFDRVQALDMTTLKGLDAIKAQFQWENPELTGQQVDKLLAKKYNLFPTSEDDDLSDEQKEDKELGKIQIITDSKKSLEVLSKIKAEQSIPDPERLRIKEEKDEVDRVASWQPTAQKIVADFNDFDIPLAVDEKGNITDTFKFTDVTPELKKVLLDDIRNIVEISGSPHTAEEAALMNKMVKERFLIRNFTAISKAMAAEMKTRADKAARAEYTNGNPPPAGDAPPGSALKSGADTLYEKHMASYGAKV